MRKNLIFLICFLLPVISSAADQENMISQVSTSGAVFESLYDGVITFTELKKLGDMGIGYNQKMDGESICIDGRFYHFKEDGTAVESKENEKAPFYTMTFFKSDTENFTNRKFDLQKLKNYLLTMMPRKNSPYAIKISGKFSSVKLRTFIRQFKPYPSMNQVYRDQKEYNYTNIDGVLIGFYCPEFLSNINITGFHFHFISNDRKRGGHVLECDTSSINIEVIESGNLKIIVPRADTFQNAKISKFRKKEISKVEK